MTFETLSGQQVREIDSKCDEFELRLQLHEQPDIESLIEQHQEPVRTALLKELISLELYYSRLNGGSSDPKDYLIRFPEHSDLVLNIFADTDLTYSDDSCQLRPGDTIGDYEIIETIGGNQAMVYKAKQLSAQRIVALKVFPRKSSQLVRNRFEKEGISTAQFENDHIVTVFHIGEDDGFLFYSMKFVDGQDLSEIIRESALECRKAATYMSSVGRAVQHAHVKGVLHRDLKPGNILIDQQDRAYVADFGLAYFTEPSQENHLQRELVGTPAYMSPEQAACEEVDARTDVYGLGATLYSLLTRQTPFQASSLEEMLENIQTENPRRIRLIAPDVPADLEAICIKSMSKVPADRYETAGEFAEELDRWLRHQPVKARPPHPLRRMLLAYRRNPVIASLLVLLAFAFTSGLTVSLYQWHAVFISNQERGQLLHQKEELISQKEQLLAEEEKLLYASDVQSTYSRWKAGDLWAIKSVLGRQLQNRDRYESRFLNTIYHSAEASDIHFDEAIASCACLSDNKHAVVATVDFKIHLVDLEDRSALTTFTPVERIGISLREQRGMIFVAGVIPNTAAENAGLSVGDQIVSIIVQDSEISPKNVTHARDLLRRAEDAETTLVVQSPLEVAIRRFAIEPSFISNSGRVTHLVAHPTKAYFASLQPDRIVRVWSIGQRSPIHELVDYEDARAIAFSYSGEQLAVAHADGVYESVSIFNLESGRTEDNVRIGLQAFPITALEFVPNQNRLLIRTTTSAIEYDLDSHRTKEVATHVGGGKQISISGDGRLIAESREQELFVWNLENAQPRYLASHHRWVNAVEFASGSHLLAAGTEGGEVEILEDESGVLLNRLLGHEHSVVDLSFTPDTKRLVSGDSGGRLIVWNPLSNQEFDRIPMNSPLLSALTFHQNSQSLLYVATPKIPTITSPQSEIGEFNLATGETIDYQGQAESIQTLVFTPDGSRLAVSLGGSPAPARVEVWNLESREVEVRLAPNVGKEVFALAFSPDGNSLAIGGTDLNYYDGGLAIWDFFTKDWRTQQNSVGTGIVALEFCQGEQAFLVAGCSNHQMRLYAVDGKLLESIELAGRFGEALAVSHDTSQYAIGGNTPFLAGEAKLTLMDSTRLTEQQSLSLSSHIHKVTYSPDDTLLLTTGMELPLSILNRADGQLKSQLKVGGTALAWRFQSDKELFVVNNFGEMGLWNSDTGDRFGDPIFTGRILLAAACAESSPLVATGGIDGVIEVYDCGTMQQLYSLRDSTDSPHSGSATSLAYSSDGSTFLSTSEDGSIALWNRLDRSVKQVFRGHSGSVLKAAFFNNDRRIVSATGLTSLLQNEIGQAKSQIKIWNVETAECLHTIDVQHGLLADLILLPDKTTVLAVTSGVQTQGELIWFDLESRTELRSVECPNRGITCLASTSDGQRVVIGSVDQKVAVWNEAARQWFEPATISGGAVYAVAISNDNETVAIGTKDGSVDLRTLEGLQPLLTLKSGSGEVSALAFSQDGMSLVAAINSASLFGSSPASQLLIWPPRANHFGKE